MEPMADAAPAEMCRPAEASAVEDTAGEAAIDLAHLARMTFGETGLEAEVLDLFERQADVLLAHIQDATPTAAAAFAHTLKGSARGVGAFGLAAAADAVETSARCADAAATACAVTRLAAAVASAKAAIADWGRHRREK